MADNTSNYKLKISTEANLAGVREAESSIDRLKRKAGGGEAFGGFLKLEDKVSLGSGNKLVGPAAAAIAGALTLSESMKAVAGVFTGYKNALSMGIDANAAFSMAMMEAGKKIPIFGGVLEGIIAIGDEITGRADVIRAQQKYEQKIQHEKEVVSIAQKNSYMIFSSRWGLQQAQGQVDLQNEKDPVQKQIKQARLAAQSQVNGLLDQIRNLDLDTETSDSVKEEVRKNLTDTIRAIGENLKGDIKKINEAAYDASKKASEDEWSKYYQDISKQDAQDQQTRRGYLDSLLGLQSSSNRASGNNANASRIDLARNYMSQADQLKQILSDPASSDAEKQQAKALLGGLVGQYQSEAGKIGLGQVSSSEFVNASLAKSSGYVLGGGIASSAQESAILTSENPSQTTADNSTEILKLLQKYLSNPDAASKSVFTS